MPLAIESWNLAGAAAAALAAAVALLALGGLRRVHGTTLAAPMAWAIAAAICFAAVEATLAWNGGSGDGLGPSLARYATAVGTCCPLMAVLGAKRPQDRGWQWVVASLWIVLLVPAGQAWASRAGDAVQLSAMWKLMLGALAALGLLNYLPTRHGISAALFAGGQLALFSEFLLNGPVTSRETDRAVAAAAALLAALLAGAPRSRRQIELDSPQLSRCNERWLAFRDGWGAFWALRVQQRVNESATLSDWPARLAWSGFARCDGATSSEVDDRVAAQIEQTLDSLLRRFEPAPIRK